MNGNLYAEIDADGQRIEYMVVAANDDTLKYAARLLRTTTPAHKAGAAGSMWCPLTWAAVTQMSATFGAAWVPGPRLCAWIEQQMMLRAAPDLSRGLLARRTIPAGLTPRPYQVEGANLIAQLGQVLITDEPGTGKTITTILGLLERWVRSYPGADDYPNPILVVAPASVVDPWVQAFTAWVPTWRTIAWRGAPAKRRQLIGTADVYVTSYDLAMRDASDTTAKKSPLIALGAKSLVVDECHLIKNPSAARSHAVRRLAQKATTFVALSGTPITHHPADLWPTLVCLQPGAFPARERFVQRYIQSIPMDYGENILGLNPAAEAEFRMALLGQQRRVAKADVLDQLPPKVYSIRSVNLPEEWRKAYDQLEHEMLTDLPDDGGELSVMDVLSQLNCLSRMACAPADVSIDLEQVDDGIGGVIDKRHVHLTLKNPSWKVDALLEILAERPGQPVVTFAQSRQLVLLAGQAAEEAGLRVGYIIGGQSQKNRTETVARFQAGELDLICVTTQAGGVGITLTAASTVVFLQRPWSLVDSIQAEDRCHRIGSERHESIEIIDIIATDTIDTRVRSALREKAGQLSDLVQDPRIVAELLGGASVTHIKGKAA